MKRFVTVSMEGRKEKKHKELDLASLKEQIEVLEKMIPYLEETGTI